MGNSTCVWVEVANQLGATKVVSVCWSDDWQRRTEPLLRQEFPDAWFRCLTPLTQDIRLVDYAGILGGKERVLVFWDAHGYDVAEVVLGIILPLLESRKHVVVMHDISDVKYIDQSYLSYNGARLWRTNHWQDTSLIIGNYYSQVEQLVAILDFTSRNALTLHSADHALATELPEGSDRADQLKQLVAIPFLTDRARWFWFSTNEHPAGTRPLTYPSMPPLPAVEQMVVAEPRLTGIVVDAQRDWRDGKPTFTTVFRMLVKHLLRYYH